MADETGQDLLDQAKAFTVSDEALAGMTHDEAQAMQWRIDEAIQQLQLVKERVHTAREREDLKNRPPARPNPQVVGFGAGPLPQAPVGGAQ